MISASYVHKHEPCNFTHITVKVGRSDGREHFTVMYSVLVINVYALRVLLCNQLFFVTDFVVKPALCAMC